MLPTKNNFPSVEYTLLEESWENDKNAYGGGDNPLLELPTCYPVDDFGTPPPRSSTHRLQPGWLGWVEWFKSYLSSSKRDQLRAADTELQEIVSEGRELRLEAEAISAQREGWYEFREQTGCRLGWKTVVGAALITAAAIFGYDRYRSWWHSPHEGLQGRDRPYPTPGDAPLPEAAALESYFFLDLAKLSKVAYEYTDVQPAQCKTETFLNRCKTAHSSAKKLISRMALTVVQIPCLCPPPAGSFVKIIPPTCKKISMKYQYTENQTDACKTKDFLRQCDDAFSKANTLFEKMALKAVGGELCLCPPPIPPFSVTFTVVPPVGGWPPPSTPAATPTATLPGESGDRDQPDRGTLAGEGSTPPPISGDVRIENLFDFSCINEQSDPSWVDRLRQVGKTLSSSVNAMGEELLVIDSHNQQPRCPSQQPSQPLKNIISNLDSVLNSTLLMLPHSAPLAWARLIIGPMLQLAADELSGAEPEVTELEGLSQQLRLLARQTLPTLSQSEFAMLYHKLPMKNGTVPASEEPRLANRFTIRNNQLYVKINHQDYVYRVYNGSIPHVVAGERAKIIRFNQKEKQWEFVNQQETLTYAADNSAPYGLSLTQLFEKPKTEIKLDSRQLLKITDAAGGDFLGISMNDTIVPVEIYEVNGVTTFIASLQKNKEARVLLHTHYGWVFEQASVDMDKYLGFLLDSKDNGISYTSEKKFSPIKSDGFSYDEQGEAFIKKNDKYYPVYKFMAGHAVSGHTPSLFTRENGRFTLQVAHNMLFGFKSVSVGYPLLEPDFSIVQLETEGRDYLMEHGVKSNALLRSRIWPSLYSDDEAQVIFSDSKNNFVVSHYLDSQINLNKSGDSYIENQDDIPLWLDEDLYLRIRDETEKEPVSYSEVSSCQNTTAPGQEESCRSVLIENSLDRLLTSNIELGRTINKAILDKTLAQVKLLGTQVLFFSLDNGNYYFLYKEHYFTARLLNVYENQNATGKTVIQLYNQCTFYSCKRPIASVIIEEVDQRIEIKQQKTFLVEKLNIREEVADNYLQSRPYRRAVGMEVVENAVEQGLHSENRYLDEFSEAYQQEIPESTLNKIVCKQLFPSRIVENPDYVIKIFELNNNSATLLPYMREAQENIKQKLDYINKFLLPSEEFLLPSNQFLEGSIEEYFSSILNSDRLKILSNKLEFLYDFSSALKKRLKMIANTLKIADINLVTAIKNGDESSINPESVLTEGEQYQGGVAFMTPDKNRRIFINIDKTYIPFSRPNGTTDVISLLIHEASRAGGMATDIVHLPREQAGQSLPILDAIDAMIDTINSGGVIDANNFNQLSKRYLKNISGYRNRLSEMMNERKLAYLAKNDPGYLAHLMLNSSDLLFLLIMNLHDAAIYGTATTKTASIAAYRRAKNILAISSISTVYDLHNGYVMQDYQGIVTAERRLRFAAAANGVDGMNRLYGNNSAMLLMHPEEEGSSSFSVKMIKVPGLPVSSILKISNRAQLEIYRTAVKKFSSQANHPAVELSEKLRINGVKHPDISEATLVFDIDKGFNLIDFDSAEILPAGEPLSDKLAADQTKQLRYVIGRLSRFVALPPFAFRNRLASPDIT